MRSAIALLAGLLLAPHWLQAAPRDVSASAWTVAGDSIAVRYSFPKELSALLTQQGRPSPSMESIGKYVLSTLSVQREGVACEALDQGYDLGRIDARYAGADLLSFEVLFRCPPGPGALAVRNDAFFDRSPRHLDLARLRVDDTLPVSRLITARHDTVEVTRNRRPPASRLSAYVGLGVTHVLTGLIGALAALGFSLLLRTRRDAVTLVAGLALGYVLSAVAAGIGGWIVEPSAAQVFEGFLIALMGTLVVAERSGRPGVAALGLVLIVMVASAVLGTLHFPAAAACLTGAALLGGSAVYAAGASGVARQRRVLLPALLMGTADGFWFASVYAPLQAAVPVGTAQLLGCNIGAWLGSLLIIALLCLLRFGLLRFIRLPGMPWAADLVTGSLCAMGMFRMLVP